MKVLIQKFTRKKKVVKSFHKPVHFQTKLIFHIDICTTKRAERDETPRPQFINQIQQGQAKIFTAYTLTHTHTQTLVYLIIVAITISINNGLSDRGSRPRHRRRPGRNNPQIARNRPKGAW